MPKPRLYVAVEIPERELLAKTLLASAAAKEGFDVRIGQSEEIRDLIRFWPPGILLWKGLASKNAKMFDFYHKLGHSVISWCEEGFTYANRESYRQLRVSPETLAEVDVFFAWGQHQYDDIEKVAPHLMHKVRIVGNPRIDLLRPEFRDMYQQQIADIRARFGPFILVNTNFNAFLAPGGPAGFLERVKQAGAFKYSSVEKFYRDSAAYGERFFPKYIEAIINLAQEFTDRSVVVRPHPGEDLDTWNKALAGEQRIFIERDGSAVPWMLASELVIHSDCTTGVEAYLLDKAVISYRPTSGGLYKQLLPIAVSYKVVDLKTLLMAVRNILDKNYDALKGNGGVDHETVRYFLPHINGDSSVSMVMKVIKTLRKAPNSKTASSTEAWLRRNRFKIRSFFSSDNQGPYTHGVPNEIQRAVKTLWTNKQLGLKPLAEPVRGTTTCFTITQAGN